MSIYEQSLLFDNNYILYGTIYEGQNIRSPVAFNITSIDVKMFRLGSGCGNMTAYVYAVDGSLLPTGAALATSSAVASGTITTDSGGEFVTFTFIAAAALSANTTYAIVLVPSGGDVSNRINCIGITASAYPSGGRLYSSDSGSSWTLLTSDLTFKVNGTGTYVLNNYYDGTQTAYNSIDLNAANDWVFQSFTPTETYAVNAVAIYCAKGSGDNIGTITVGIYAVDGSGNPTGTALASGTIANAAVAAAPGYAFVPCVFGSTAVLNSGTQYALRINGTSLDASNILILLYDTDGAGLDPYAGGVRAFSVDGGGSWTQDSLNDYMFRVYGASADLTATSSATSSETAALTYNVWRRFLMEYMPGYAATLGSLTLTDGSLTLTGLTDHSLLFSNVGLVSALGAATNGQIPIGSTGADPVLATITGTANQVVSTPGAGTITLSLPQDIHTGASPTFVGLNLTGTILWEADTNLYRLSANVLKTDDNFQCNLIGVTNQGEFGGTLRSTGVVAPTSGVGVEVFYSSGEGRILCYNRSTLAYDDLVLDGNPAKINTYSGNDIVLGALNGIIKGTSGTLSAITDNSANWNTAYGWGNHAGLYDASGTAAGLIGTHEGAYTHADIALNTTHRTSNGTDHSYINQSVKTTDSPSFIGGYFTDAELTNPVTTYGTATSYCKIEPDSASDGGCRIWGFSDAVGQRGLVLFGIIGVTDPTDTTPCITLVGGKSDGATSATILGPDETILNVENWGTSRFKVMGDGALVVGGSETGITGAELEDLSDGGETTLHYHSTGTFVYAIRDTSAQTIGNGAWATAICNSEIADAAGEYDNATGIFTAAVAGKYLCIFCGLFNSLNQGTEFGVRWLKNGATVTNYKVFQGAANAKDHSADITSVVDLAATDTIRAQVIQWYGSDRTLGYGSTAPTSLLIKRLSV